MTASADAVLLAHAALVLFVVCGPLLVLIGAWRGWAWTRRRGWRRLHLLAIAVVVAESWLGIECPLTTLEAWLRTQAGQTQAQDFIAYWVGRLLFVEAEPWVFSTVYSGFALLVLWTWRRWPPDR